MKKLTKERLDFIKLYYSPEFYAAVVKDNGIWLAIGDELEDLISEMMSDIHKYFPYEALRDRIFAKPDDPMTDDYRPFYSKLLFKLSEPFWAYEEEHGPQPSFYLTQAEGAARLKAEIAKMTPAECRAELAAREANRALVETWMKDYQMEQVA